MHPPARMGTEGNRNVRSSAVLLSCVFTCTLASAVSADNQNPNLNWGYTDFMDAAIQGSGVIFNPKVAIYSANSLRDGNGNALPGENQLSLTAFSPQLIYIGRTQLPGGLKWGVQVLGTAVSLNAQSDLGLAAGHGMMGDVCFGPLIGGVRPLKKDLVLHWFAEFDTYAPLGQYDKTVAFNPGANFWTFEPFLAVTLQMPSGFELSTRQHVAFNTANDEYVNPALTGDFHDHSLKAGNLWHFNWSFSKSLDSISPKLRFGAVGYYGLQVGDDELDGVELTDSKEKVFAIGQGLQYMHFPKGAQAPAVILSLKTYFEGKVEHRAKGVRTIVRVIVPF